MKRGLVALGLLGGGCGGSLSNATFLEDAEFTGAIPLTEDLAVAKPAEGVEGEAPELLQLVKAGVDWSESWVGLSVGVGEMIRGIAPSERGEGYRVWGPAEWSAAPGSFMRVEMTRSTTGSVFTHTVQGATTSVGLWQEMMTGTHYTGEESITEGIGELEWDLDALSSVTGGESSGVVRIGYDLTAGLMLSLSIRDVWLDGEQGDFDSLISEEVSEEGEGYWRYVFDGGMEIHGGGEVEELQLEGRWGESGAGWATAVATGGDLGEVRWQLSQCWDEMGELVAQWDDLGWVEVVGEIGGCLVQ